MRKKRQNTPDVSHHKIYLLQAHQKISIKYLYYKIAFVSDNTEQMIPFQQMLGNCSFLFAFSKINCCILKNMADVIY